MSRLKPCPFCGCNPRRKSALVSKYNLNVWKAVVYCTNCGANIEITYSAPHWVKDPEREAKRTIAKLWNRRCPNEKILNEEQTQEAKEYIYGILLTAKPQVTTEELAEYLAEHGVTFRER